MTHIVAPTRHDVERPNVSPLTLPASHQTVAYVPICRQVDARPRHRYGAVRERLVRLCRDAVRGKFRLVVDGGQGIDADLYRTPPPVLVLESPCLWSGCETPALHARVRDTKVGFWDSAGLLRLSLRSGYANTNGSGPAERDTVSRRCKPTDLNAEHFRPWRGRTMATVNPSRVDYGFAVFCP